MLGDRVNISPGKDMVLKPLVVLIHRNISRVMAVAVSTRRSRINHSAVTHLVLRVVQAHTASRNPSMVNRSTSVARSRPTARRHLAPIHLRRAVARVEGSWARLPAKRRADSRQPALVLVLAQERRTGPTSMVRISNMAPTHSRDSTVNTQDNTPLSMASRKDNTLRPQANLPRRTNGACHLARQQAARASVPWERPP